MPGFRAVLSALAAAACAAGLAACGGDDEGGPIPVEQGNQLLDQLDEIEALVDAGACDDAQELASVFAQNVGALPLEEEDPALRQALVEAGNNLEALTGDPDQCAPETGPSGLTGPVPPAETTTTTTEPTTTTTTEPEKETGPPDEPPGGGNGKPGGGKDEGGSGEDDSSGGIGSDG